MAVIYRHQLTTAERKAIERRHAPYHRFEEFWLGLIRYQEDCNSRSPWPDSSVAGQAFDRGREAAMRLHWERYSCPYARDDLDSRIQIATLQLLNEEREQERERERWNRLVATAVMFAEEDRRYKADPDFRAWVLRAALTPTSEKIVGDRRRPRLVIDNTK